MENLIYFSNIYGLHIFFSTDKGSFSGFITKAPNMLKNHSPRRPLCRSKPVKIWFIVFCCSTTGPVDTKVMEDYSTTSFFLGIIRFACKIEYPKMLMPDEGSQLVKGCKDMQIDFSNLQYRLENVG